MPLVVGTQTSGLCDCLDHYSQEEQTCITDREGSSSHQPYAREDEARLGQCCCRQHDEDQKDWLIQVSLCNVDF